MNRVLAALAAALIIAPAGAAASTDRHGAAR